MNKVMQTANIDIIENETQKIQAEMLGLKINRWGSQFSRHALSFDDKDPLEKLK